MDIFYPIQIFANWLTYTVFGLVSNTLLAGAINFFIFDTIKIFILLSVIIFIVSIVRSYLPPEKIRSILSHKNNYSGKYYCFGFGNNYSILFLFGNTFVFGICAVWCAVGCDFFFSGCFTND